MRKIILIIWTFVCIFSVNVFSQSDEVLREAYEAGEDKLNANNCGYDSCVFYGVARWKFYIMDGPMPLGYAQKDKNDRTRVNVCYLDGTLWGYYKLQPSGKWIYTDVEDGK